MNAPCSGAIWNVGGTSPRSASAAVSASRSAATVVGRLGAGPHVVGEFLGEEERPGRHRVRSWRTRTTTSQPSCSPGSPPTPWPLIWASRSSEVRPGYARADDGPSGRRCSTPSGTAHGGATMALLDVVHAAVSNSHGTVAVAQDVHTEFLAAGRPGDRLVAEGVEVHRTTRTAVYRIEARAQDDRLIATALARVFRTDRPWSEVPA